MRLITIFQSLRTFLSHQITNFFNSQKLFSPEQHCFRSNHSCETAIQTILDNWKRLLEKKKNILTLFIDFKKDFDLINPELLFLKLVHHGFDNNSLYLIMVVLGTTSTFVDLSRVEVESSEIYPVDGSRNMFKAVKSY